MNFFFHNNWKKWVKKNLSLSKRVTLQAIKETKTKSCQGNLFFLMKKLTRPITEGKYAFFEKYLRM